MTVLLVALGGALGATTRYLTGRYVDSYRSFPVATFLVNVAGCLILGLLSGASMSVQTFALLGTGFCGGLTTYSTMAWVVARMCASLKALSRLDPRWPDVPNTTCCKGFSGSGTPL